MNYQQPGNFLQDQGYFQINTTLLELASNPQFKLFLSGQYLLELVDVCVDTQYLPQPGDNTAAAIFQLRSPQFSSTMSETPGITFSPPQLIQFDSENDTFYYKYSGQTKPAPNKILATLNGAIALELYCWEVNTGINQPGFYETAAECFNIPIGGGASKTANGVLSFGFQYSRVR
jgi:hypothetical protein